MSELRMGAIESRFADIIWQNEPITSPELVKLAAKELDWTARLSSTSKSQKALKPRSFLL